MLSDLRVTAFGPDHAECAFFNRTPHAAALLPVAMKLFKIIAGPKVDPIVVLYEPGIEPDLGVSRYPVVLTRMRPRSRIRKFFTH